MPLPARGPSTAGEIASESEPDAESDPSLGHSSLAASLLPTTLRTAVDNLRRNKMRSALTALGVIIGVGAVIAMTEIGQGSKAAIDKAIASMGTYKLTIFPGAAQTGGVSQGMGTVQSLKPADVDAIEEQCDAVEVAAPMVWPGPSHLWKTQLVSGDAQRHFAAIPGHARLGRHARRRLLHG